MNEGQSSERGGALANVDASSRRIWRATWHLFAVGGQSKPTKVKPVVRAAYGAAAFDDSTPSTRVKDKGLICPPGLTDLSTTYLVVGFSVLRGQPLR